MRRGRAVVEAGEELVVDDFAEDLGDVKVPLGGGERPRGLSPAARYFLMKTWSDQMNWRAMAGAWG